MKIVLSSICLESGTDIQLALYYLKGYLLARRPACRVEIEVFIERKPVAGMARKILKLAPDLVGFSCYIWNIEKTLQLCARLKKIRPGLIIVLGGPEVSPRARQVLAEHRAVDAIVRHEGEVTFAELVERIVHKRTWPGIKGISFRKGIEVVENPDRPQMRALARIPSAYLAGLVDLKNKNIVDVPLETTRGCAYRCRYCYYHKNFPVVRNFPLSRVQKELKLILAHKPHEVYLMDATFNANRPRAKKILRMFIRYSQGSNLHVELRAELVDEEMARLLSKANAYNIEIGIQSINAKTLHATSRTFNKKQFKRGIRLLNKYGLYYEIQLIDALPYQRYSDLMRALDWLYGLHPAKVVIFRLAVLPGSSLRQDAARYGIVYGAQVPYHARMSHVMSEAELAKIQKLWYAMDRLYDSQVFQKTLYAFKAKAHVKLSQIMEDWVEWEGRFKRRPVDYPEFLNRKSPLFLEYLCRRHGAMHLYGKLLPGLLKKLM